MATDTFQNTTADGDLSNFANYDTLSVPTSADNLVLAAIPTNCATSNAPVPCLNISDSSGTGANYLGGSGTTPSMAAYVECHGTATGIQTNGGYMGPSPSGNLTCSGCIFTTDPGFNLGSGTPTVHFVSACELNVVMNDATTTVTDDGTAEFSSGITLTFASFTATAINDGNQAVTFSCPLTCPSVTLQSSSSNFNDGLTQNGPSVTLNMTIAPASAVTWNSVVWTEIGTISGPVINTASISGSTATVVLTGSGGTVTASIPSTPANQYVLGPSYGGPSGGAATLPVTIGVLKSIGTWGVNGTGSQGTLVEQSTILGG